VPFALALVDGKVGVVVAPRGRLSMALEFEIREGKIATIDVVADPERLRRLDVALLD
jgi:RNA polymerase sigma-70 factor (ECF subfamily)